MKTLILTFAALLLATGCRFELPDDLRLDEARHQLRRAGAEVHDFDRVATCSAGGCVQVCKAGDACAFTCSGGDCEVWCEADSACSTTCSGGECDLVCRPHATCASTCSGGDCWQAAAPRR